MVSHPAYLAPPVEIMELICILKLVRSAVFVVTFPEYSIQFNPTVSLTLIGYSLFGLTSTTIRDYVSVRPTGILLHATRRILFVPLLTFPINPCASSPHSL